MDPVRANAAAPSRFAFLRAIWSMLDRRERRQVCVLIGVNIVAAFFELVGVFSILPFLALAGNPATFESPLAQRFGSALGLHAYREFVLAAGALTIVAILFTNVVSFVSLTYRTRASFDIVRGMSERLFEGYLAQPYAFFLSRNTSVLGKDLLGEVWRFQNVILEPLTVLIARGLTLLLVVAGLVVYDWRAAFVVFVVLGGFFAGVYALLQHRLQYFGKRRFMADENRFRIVAEALGGIRETQLFNRERWFLDHFRRNSSVVTHALGRSYVYGTSPRYFLEATAFTFLVGIVLVVVARGGALKDILPLLGLYAVAGVRLMPALQLVYGSFVTLKVNAAGVERVHALFNELGSFTLDATNNATTPGERLPLRKSLVLREVSFSYTAAGRSALTGISLEIPAYSCVGIAGPSGAGKTTLADLCLGLLEPSSGEIIADGVPLTAENRRRWMANVGYVPQQIYLSDSSLAANIAFGFGPDRIDRARVEAAARLANLHEFITTQLPKGYDTEIGERGVRLSGGQRQRLAIARALYHDPDVLFFDEATSALDSETEEAIVDSIRSLAHRKTIILIAHRLTTLRYCDRVFVLKDGHVDRVCSFDELVANESVSSARGATRS